MPLGLQPLEQLGPSMLAGVGHLRAKHLDDYHQPERGRLLVGRRRVQIEDQAPTAQMNDPSAVHQRRNDEGTLGNKRSFDDAAFDQYATEAANG